MLKGLRGKGRTGRAGFTLVELLVVMAVLAILGTIVIGGARMILRTARKRRFTTTKMVLKTALMRYRAEYNGWPVGPADEYDDKDENKDTGDVTYTWTTRNYKLFDALRSSNNPDEIHFVDETTLLTLDDGAVKSLANVSQDKGNPIVYIPLSGKGHAYYSVTINFDLDTMSVGPDDDHMATGEADDDY